MSNIKHLPLHDELPDGYRFVKDDESSNLDEETMILVRNGLGSRFRPATPLPVTVNLNIDLSLDEARRLQALAGNTFDGVPVSNNGNSIYEVLSELIGDYITTYVVMNGYQRATTLFLEPVTPQD